MLLICFTIDVGLAGADCLTSPSAERQPSASARKRYFFSDASAPFFAGAKLPSMKASSQSSNPFSSTMERNFRQISSYTPRSSHSRKRRQHVDELGYRSGKSCHLAPVRRTHRIPSKTSRLSAGGRPPLGFGLGFKRSFPLLIIYELPVFSHWSPPIV